MLMFKGDSEALVDSDQKQVMLDAGWQPLSEKKAMIAQAKVELDIEAQKKAYAKREASFAAQAEANVKADAEAKAKVAAEAKAKTVAEAKAKAEAKAEEEVKPAPATIEVVEEVKMSTKTAESTPKKAAKKRRLTK